LGPDVPSGDLEAAAHALRTADEVLVERASPGKRPKHVDVRRFLGDVHVVAADEGPSLRAYVRLTEAGSAKPEEVIRALGAVSERSFAPVRTVRESIAIAEPGTGGRVAEPELVGADVPEGPAKPWGAC
jgi:hypothetical protein